MDRNDLEMMKNPEGWPFEVLPLKRYNGTGYGSPTCAIIYYLDDGACKFHVNVTVFGPLRGADLNGIVTTPEKLVADGWVVD